MHKKLLVERLGPSRARDLANALQVLVPPGEVGHDVSSPAHTTHLTQALGLASCYVFLATEAGAPIGYASGYRFPRLDAAGDQVYLFDIEVASTARNRGVGRRLLGALLANCWAEGVQWVWAGTPRENVAAQRLFSAVGGQRVGETYMEYHFMPE